MRTSGKGLLTLVFALTGFSALTLQVVWQRVLSLHAGVDLVSFTTVVAAFLAGIGVGSLLGGTLADRLGARASVLAFAGSNLAIGVFSWASIWVFYDLYEAQAANLTSPWTKFAFNFVLLLVPTTLMGLSLPLVAKGVVSRVGEAGPLVGRLYAVNTIGAALGAAVTGWVLLGTLGFTTTVRVAGTLNVIAAALLLAVHRLGARAPSGSPAASSGAVPASDPANDPASETASDPVASPGGEPAAWPWYLVYGLTGAVALGFETVFFRVIDTAMRSNSYSFAHVLSIYLLLFGAGSALAAPLVKRARRPGAWFLWIQFGVGVSALAGMIALTRGVPRTPWAEAANGYFASEGFVIGFQDPSGGLRGETLPIFLGLPLLVMGLPVLGMGASFPFVQALVAQRMSSLGRHTGRLMFANIVGNVAGTLFVGFVLIGWLGTSGTYRALALALLVPGVVAAWMTGGALPRRVGLVVAAAVVMLLVVRVMPPNQYVYAKLHGVDLDRLHLAEDRTCANALRMHDSGAEEMTVNASPQNNYPFDEFHLVLGLTAALMQEDPSNVMALGLGIGATPYGVSLDPRVDAVHAVEICAPQLPLLRDLGERRAPELEHLFADPRVDLVVGDGRDYLLRADQRFDVIVTDTLRPQAGFSGNLYSTEFYELVRDRLTDTGLFAQWVPTTRTLNTMLEVFPYALQFATPGYQGSSFIVAGTHAMPFAREDLLRRWQATPADSGLTAETRASIERFFAAIEPLCRIDPSSTGPLTGTDQINRDLQPRDEYFLNQTDDVPSRVRCAETPG